MWYRFWKIGSFSLLPPKVTISFILLLFCGLWSLLDESLLDHSRPLLSYGSKIWFYDWLCYKSFDGASSSTTSADSCFDASKLSSCSFFRISNCLSISYLSMNSEFESSHWEYFCTKLWAMLPGSSFSYMSKTLVWYSPLGPIYILISICKMGTRYSSSFVIFSYTVDPSWKLLFCCGLKLFISFIFDYDDCPSR